MTKAFHSSHFKIRNTYSMMGWHSGAMVSAASHLWDLWFASPPRFHMCRVCIFSLCHHGVSSRYSSLSPQIHKHAAVYWSYQTGCRYVSVPCKGSVPRPEMFPCLVPMCSRPPVTWNRTRNYRKSMGG